MTENIIIKLELVDFALYVNGAHGRGRYDLLLSKDIFKRS